MATRKPLTLVKGQTAELQAGDTLDGIGSSVFWARISNSSIVSLTGTGTLTIDRMHTIACTGADGVFTFPAVSGNAGKVIGIHVLPSNTKRVTLDGNASELLDGVASIQVSRNSTTLWYCDGSGWMSLTREQAPGIFLYASTNAGQVVTHTTEDIIFEDESVDSHAIWDGDTLIVPVTGLYLINVHLLTLTANNKTLTLNAGSTVIAVLGHSAGSAPLRGTLLVQLTAGTNYSFRLGLNNATIDTEPTSNILSVTFIGPGA